MREIKFRAWDGEKMVSPDNIDRTGTAWWYENSIPETSKTIMQYTGLKDKNGKEIYEGDVFTSEWRRDRHVIQFSGGAFRGSPGTGVGFVFDTYESSTSTILGNIYENPELLK